MTAVDELSPRARRTYFLMKTGAPYFLHMPPSDHRHLSKTISELIGAKMVYAAIRDGKARYIPTDGKIVKVKVYSNHPNDGFECKHCERAKRMLKNAGVRYELIEIPAEDRPSLYNKFGLTGKARTIPIITIDDINIGGADDLEHLIATGQI